MKFLKAIFVVTLLGNFSPAFAANPPEIDNLVVLGNIPGEYVGRDKNKSFFGYVRIQNRLIQEVRVGDFSSLVKNLQSQQSQVKLIHASRDGKTYDTLYPGLINLHNHTNYNNLPVWRLAHGQFANRFEWRAWGPYTKSVSGNVNPWTKFGSAAKCAVFRWSEIQAMTLGTAYLQGPSSCVTDFAIHRVEDAGAFLSQKKGVQAPTDTIIPEDMSFVWNTLGPVIRSGKTYEEALAQVLTRGAGKWKGCEGLKGVVTAANVNSDEILKILSDQDELKSRCGIQTEADEALLPEKFVRYVYWRHKTVASRKAFMKSEGYSAVITHLAEGRADDPYNKAEFKILELLGLIGPQMNLVHGVGVDKDGLKLMAKNQMGIVWSPFSNLLLYSDTLDLARVLDAEKAAGGKRVLIALGSDWQPTGTKGVLEELSVARAWVEKSKLTKRITDEDLYRMVTENPARMISHWEIDEDKGEHGIGRLAPGAMGSIIAVSSAKETTNPYTNLVRHATDKAVNLVVVDGKPMYGNASYLAQVGIDKNFAEEVTREMAGFETLAQDSSIPVPPAEILAGGGGDAEGDEAASENTSSPKALAKAKYVAKLASIAHGLELTDRHTGCGAPEPKLFVHQDSLAANGIDELKTKTGLNLDRLSDITRFIGLNLMTQTRNKITAEPEEFLLKYFPPLLSCNDAEHRKRVGTMVMPKAPRGDQHDADMADREAYRERASIGSVSKKFAEMYK